MLIVGFGAGVYEILEYVFIQYIYKFTDLIVSDTIIRATYRSTIDASFLIYAAIVYLISLVCRYGATLQQQVDETL